MSKSGVGKTNWVLAGWIALHQATLNAGAEVNYYPDDYPELRNRSFANTRQYEELVGPLTELLDTELETPSIRTEPVRILVWRKLRTLGRKECPDLWFLLANAAQRVDPAQEYQREQASWLSGRGIRKPLSPILAARHGYRMLWRGKHDYLRRTELLLWGLALIGWSARHWQEVAICEFCFRQTYPGTRYCDEHTQSARTGVKQSLASSHYRLGKKVHALADQRGHLDFLRGNAIERDARRRLALSDVIFQWGYEPDAISSEMTQLQWALAASPRVLGKIGTTELDDFETLTEILREKLDPYRWDSINWGLTVLQAELWFTLEEELSPGKRGYGRITEERIARAEAMAERGLTSRQIAHELGVSDSAVSKWFSRGRLVKRKSSS